MNHEIIKQAADKHFQDVLKIRRHLHQYPELSYEEHKTSGYVKEQLNSLGIESRTMAGTGLVARVKGKDPEKKVIALRGDMDALPIQEANVLPYRSKHQGVMHACGHDVHTSSLLGAIKILNDFKDQFRGTVKLIFQPGEEKLPGGASIMIKQGVLENPEPVAIFGQHVMPELEAGTAGFKTGKFMASSDEINIAVKGKGGHAAMPYKGTDPVLMASHLIVTLQQLVSRNAPPIIPSVLSFGYIEGRGATNIIPDEVKIQGTFRTFDEEWRLDAHKRIEKMALGLVESMGGKCEIDIKKGYPCLVNEEKVTQKAIDAAEKYLGKNNVINLDLRPTAEDFAYYAQHLPACFYRLGVANSSKGIRAPLHTPYFNIEEEALKTGMGLLAFIAINELKS